MPYFTSHSLDKSQFIFFNTRIDKKAFTRSHKTFSISYNNIIHKKPHKPGKLDNANTPYLLTSIYYNKIKKNSLTVAILYILHLNFLSTSYYNPSNKL